MSCSRCGPRGTCRRCFVPLWTAEKVAEQLRAEGRIAEAEAVEKLATRATDLENAVTMAAAIAGNLLDRPPLPPDTGLDLSNEELANAVMVKLSTRPEGLLVERGDETLRAYMQRTDRR